MLNAKNLNPASQIAIAITNAPKGTGYLGFRDLPNILKKYVKGMNVLDVGCGSGRSTRFLRDLGYNVIGIDVSESMIKTAKEQDEVSDYRLIVSENEEWPLENEKFDLIMFSFVMLELSSHEKIKEILMKAKSFLSESGVLVISSTSENAYKHDWLSMGTGYPENQDPKSGDVVKIFLKDYGFEVKDYYWTDDDYQSCIKQAGLNLLWKFNPLGKASDGKKWVNEEKISPFTFYVTNNQQANPKAKPKVNLKANSGYEADSETKAGSDTDSDSDVNEANSKVQIKLKPKLKPG